jgi:hypothetical protein
MSPENIYLPASLIHPITTKLELGTFFGKTSGIEYYIYSSQKNWKKAIKLV